MIVVINYMATCSENHWRIVRAQFARRYDPISSKIIKLHTKLRLLECVKIRKYLSSACCPCVINMQNSQHNSFFGEVLARVRGIQTRYTPRASERIELSVRVRIIAGGRRFAEITGKCDARKKLE